MGRQPWLVFGLFRVDQGVSPNVTANMLWLSILIYVLIYTILIGATVYLMQKFAKAGPAATDKGLVSLDQAPSMAG